jgi:hypothetical protein
MNSPPAARPLYLTTAAARLLIEIGQLAELKVNSGYIVSWPVIATELPCSFDTAHR